MPSEYIIEVTETDFPYEVLAFSNQVPVVVDFWAQWCAPCKIIAPILERLAIQGRGSFRLAKLNVDENPAIAKHYQVQSIPCVKGFRDGVVVTEFSGLQPENLIAEFLHALTPIPGDLRLEKGKSLLNQETWFDAEEALREVLETSPDHPLALLGLARSLLAQGKGKDSLVILRNFPASKEFNTAEKLIPLADVLANPQHPGMVSDDDLLAPAYERCLNLVKKGNILAALDGLFFILREDKTYQDGNARKVSLALLEVLGDENPQTRQYRNELASILF